MAIAPTSVCIMPIGSILRLQRLQVIFFHPDMTRRNGTHFCGKIMRKRLIWRIFSIG
jgi:hypothetical protein